MRTTRDIYIAIFAVVLLTAITGMFILFHSPAPKPLPEVIPEKKQQPSIPGAPEFNIAKYANEPVVSVWMADKKTVQWMPLEQYLQGVLAKEMEPDWPLEALRAQAIASRTLTIGAIEAGTIRKLHNADVSTDKEELQAYAPEKITANVRKAVETTRGQILLYGKSLVYAIYSSSNGQICATKEESFPDEIPYPAPYFQPVADNSFKYTPANIRSWTMRVSGNEVAAAVGYAGDPANITILQKGPSGRILFIGTGNQKVNGAKFRKTIGYDRLKSTLITEMTYDGAMFTFKGLGWGNGVGLCQWGAYTYAKDGQKAEEIVAHYYIGTNIVNLWK